MKELIRRVIFIPCWLGIWDGEFKCNDGTIKHKFLTWLYGKDECFPEFTMWLPEEDNESNSTTSKHLE